MQGTYFIFALVLFFFIQCAITKQGGKSSVEEVTDAKVFKKILRTKNNVLVCFISSPKQTANIVKTFKEAADVVKGQGAMLLVDCSGEGKKMCKKLKVTPEPSILRHYKDGEFHKIYDRKDTVTSIVTFMRDPTGDMPWEEDETSLDVVHLPDVTSLNRLVKKEMLPIMVMFYAPWCGYCKQLKPEYAAAASALKSIAILAAIDVNRPENQVIRHAFNITGFPTMLYFSNGNMKYTYEGENKKDSLIAFMKDPTATPSKPKEEEWSNTPSDIVHLNAETFDVFLQAESSVLVMFYAPWCGHCKKMKPEYEKAAAEMKDEQIPGALAAVDATKESVLGKRFGIKGYPTVKYFKDGEFVWDIPTLREASKISAFMKDPKEPPPPPPPEPEWADQPSEVVHLDTENFKPFLKKKRHSLVMFYAPWCGHCKMAKPEFVAAAEELKENLRVAFAAIDCTKHSSVCSVMNVSGYPTFKYFNYYNKQTNSDYNGGRKANDFIGFMNKIDGVGRESQPKKSDPTPKPDPVPVKKAEKEKIKKITWTGLPGSEKIIHLNDANFKTSLDKSKPHLVLFYGAGCNNCETVMREFGNVASKSDASTNVVYASCDISENQKVAIEYDVKKLPAIKLFKNGKYTGDYTGKITLEEVSKYVLIPTPTQDPKTEL